MHKFIDSVERKETHRFSFIWTNYHWLAILIQKIEPQQNIKQNKKTTTDKPHIKNNIFLCDKQWMQFTSNNYKLVSVHKLICVRFRFLKIAQREPYGCLLMTVWDWDFIHTFCDLKIGELYFISVTHKKWMTYELDLLFDRHVFDNLTPFRLNLIHEIQTAKPQINSVFSAVPSKLISCLYLKNRIQVFLQWVNWQSKPEQIRQTKLISLKFYIFVLY